MSEEPLPSSRVELLERIETEWSALQTTLSQLDAEAMVRPGPDGWSVKDHLAHLMLWERGIVALLGGRPRYRAMGLDMTRYGELAGIDGINHEIHRQNRDRPLSQVLEEMRDNHEQTLAVLEGLEYADLMRPYARYAPGEEREDGDEPVLHWVVGDTYAHYREHRFMIEKMA